MRVGDFVRVSFFSLSHSLSFRSASLKTFERQIYIKQIRRHADVQLDTPRYFRERLRKKGLSVFLCSGLWTRERNFQLHVCTCTSAIRLSSQGSGVLRYAASLHRTWAMATQSCPPIEADAHKHTHTHSRQAHTHTRLALPGANRVQISWHTDTSMHRWLLFGWRCVGHCYSNVSGTVELAGFCFLGHMGESLWTLMFWPVD